MWKKFTKCKKHFFFLSQTQTQNHAGRGVLGNIITASPSWHSTRPQISSLSCIINPHCSCRCLCQSDLLQEPLERTFFLCVCETHWSFDWQEKIKYNNLAFHANTLWPVKSYFCWRKDQDDKYWGRSKDFFWTSNWVRRTSLPFWE